MILPGALKPEEADLVTPELVDRAVGVLRRTFRYVVVDLGVSMSDATLAVLDQTQHLVLIASADLSAVKSAADALTILQYRKIQYQLDLRNLLVVCPFAEAPTSTSAHVTPSAPNGLRR